jgi:hypothetical protein
MRTDNAQIVYHYGTLNFRWIFLVVEFHTRPQKKKLEILYSVKDYTQFSGSIFAVLAVCFSVYVH